MLRQPKDSRILLLVLGMMIALVVGHCVPEYLQRRNNKKVWASQNLRLPTATRRLLTNGTIDGVPWLEQQLHADRGRIIALYILNSMLAKPSASLPGPMPIMGFCGNTRRRTRRRIMREAVNGVLAQQDAAIENYFGNRAKHKFRPLPTVDWDNPDDVAGEFLAAVEAKDIGMLAVLLDRQVMEPSFRPLLLFETGRVHFHRFGGEYNVTKLALSGKRLIAYEVSGGSRWYCTDEMRWLIFDALGQNSKGMPGISNLIFRDRPKELGTASTTRLSGQLPDRLPPPTSQEIDTNGWAMLPP